MTDAWIDSSAGAAEADPDEPELPEEGGHVSASAPPRPFHDPEPPEPLMRAALERLEALVAAESGRILQAFADKLAFDRFKEEQISRLHAELQQHRDGLLDRVTRPLLNAVIRLHDDLGKVIAALHGRPREEVTPERAFGVLEGFREDVELLLAQQGVEPFEPLDDAFDPRLHTVVRTVCTGDPVRVGRIAERLRPGFIQGAALLQRARVAVYTAQGGGPPSASTIPPADGEEG